MASPAEALLEPPGSLKESRFVVGNCRIFGLDPGEIAKAALNNDALCLSGIHIERGPVLENINRPLGIVEAIAGQSRLEFTFAGRANHAGTTPMNLRHDVSHGCRRVDQRRRAPGARYLRASGDSRERPREARRKLT